MTPYERSPAERGPTTHTSPDLDVTRRTAVHFALARPCIEGLVHDNGTRIAYTLASRRRVGLDVRAERPAGRGCRGWARRGHVRSTRPWLTPRELITPWKNNCFWYSVNALAPVN